MSSTSERRVSYLAVPWWAPALFNGFLIATHAYLAVGFFGPARLSSSGSYTYVHAWAPLEAWGWALIVGAVLGVAAPFCNRWGSTVARAIAAAPLALLLAAFITAQIEGLSQGWGGLLLLWPLAAHALIVAARHDPGTSRA